MKNLAERLLALRARHESFNSTYEMADALVPMIGAAEDLVERIKELEDALRTLLADGIGTAYDHQEDEIGYHTCCRTTSYDPHSADCPAEQARSIMNKKP